MYKSIVLIVLMTFVTNTFVPQAYAQNLAISALPEPGTMISTSPAVEPVLIKGIKVYPQDPFRLDFILTPGDGGDLRDISQRLIKYFLTSLTFSEKDLWVNLSPYEKDRMITPELGQTQMGRDMLAQDYILKQLAASVIYPQKDLGKEFWDRVYAKARQIYGTDDIPMDTFHKVWVLADEARVFQQSNSAHIVSAHMKVMLESDYLAQEKNVDTATSRGDLAKQLYRELIIPEIEKEVNTGKNFATLRQIFHAFILATWFKRNLKQSVWDDVYTDQKKVGGMSGGLEPQMVYKKYLEAYKKGAFNLIQEDTDPINHESVPRKYFSGGHVLGSGHIKILDGAEELTPDEQGSLSKKGDVVVQARVDPLAEGAPDQVDWKAMMQRGEAMAYELIAAYKPSPVPGSIYEDTLRDGLLNGFSIIRGVFGLAMNKQIFVARGLGSPLYVLKGMENALAVLDDDVYRQRWLDWAPQGLKKGVRFWKGDMNPAHDLAWIEEQRAHVQGLKDVLKKNLPELRRLMEFIYKELVKPEYGMNVEYFPEEYDVAPYIFRDFPDFSEESSYLAARAIYDQLYKKMNMDLIEAGDLVQASHIAAREFFRGFQDWMMTKGQDPQRKFVLMFATGKSPEMAYKIIEDHLKMDWSDPGIRLMLQEQGIDPDQKPDMRRVVSFHLDTVMPQKRAAYFGFANIIKKWNQKFGIPEDQQNFFYGDVTWTDKGLGFRQMTSKEFSRLQADIKKNGLKIQDYMDHRLDQKQFPVQHAFFAGMENQNTYLTRHLKEQNAGLGMGEQTGGPDMVFGSTGPSHEGLGHIAFVESEYIGKTEAFVGAANHHIVAGQASQGGGYGKLMNNMGVATYSLADITQNKDAQFILIVLDNKKKNTVQKGVEGTLENGAAAPLVALQKVQGVLITDTGSGSELLINKYPWDFRLIPEEDWTDGLRRKFFVRSAMRAGKPLSELKSEDIVSFDQGRAHPLVAMVRQKNLEIILQQGSFEQQKKSVIDHMASNVIPTSGLAQKLWGQAYVDRFNAAKKSLAGLIAEEASEADITQARADVDVLRKTIISFDPHMDDRFLADPGAVKELIAEGHRVIAIAATPGSSAVSDDLVLGMLRRMISWDEAKMAKTRNAARKELSTRLKDLIERQTLIRVGDRLSYDVWNNMSSEEQDLRAQLLFNYIVNKLAPHTLSTKSQLEYFVKRIEKFIDLRPEWGAASLSILDDIKGTVRLIEEKTAMLSWGLAYDDIYDPVKPSWYSALGKLGTASPQDIINIVALFEKNKRVDAVIGNGEGFSDFEAHASTKATAIATLFALEKEGFLDRDSFVYMTYAGVWERTPMEDADVTMVYSPEQVLAFDRLFQGFYRSQAPAESPDAGLDALALFSDNVTSNGRSTAQELKSLIKLDPGIEKTLDGGGIALNFRIWNIFDPQTRTFLLAEIDKLNEVAGPLKDTNYKALYGPPPVIKDVGGIALDPARMSLGIESQGDRVKFDIDPAVLARYKAASGFIPVIIRIQPMTIDPS
jgi:hypothetical protein